MSLFFSSLYKVNFMNNIEEQRCVFDLVRGAMPSLLPQIALQLSHNVVV